MRKILSLSIVLSLLLGGIIYAQTEWSLYAKWAYLMKGDDEPKSPDLLWCDEYRYGTELCGLFDLYYDGYIAGSGTHGDGEYLWNSDNHYGIGNDIVLLEPYTGKILDSFFTEIDEGYMGFDGEYLWFGSYSSGIHCVEIGGDPGPYDPIDTNYYYDSGLEGYNGHIFGLGYYPGFHTPDILEYNREGDLVNVFPLEDYFEGYRMEDLAIDPEGNMWVFWRYELFEEYPNYLQKYDQNGNFLGEWETDANYGPITCAKTRGNMNIQNTSLGAIKAMFSDGWNNNYNPLNDKDLYEHLERFGE